MKKIGIIFAFLGLIFVFSLNFGVDSNAEATLQLPSVIGDRMVLQQQTDVNLWGWDKPGNTVTVKFRGQEVQTPVFAENHPVQSHRCNQFETKHYH